MQRSLSLGRRLAAVVGGSFLGTITRYLLSMLIQSHLGKGWPYDILLINISGALVLALVTTVADATFLIGPTRRLFINVGFLGAYTTFSSLVLGDVRLLTGGAIMSALAYLFASMLGGMLVVLAGDWLGQQFIMWMRRPSRSMAHNRSLSTVASRAEGDHVNIEDDVMMT